MDRHRARVLRLAILFWISAPLAAEACPICFRETDSPLTAGVAAGVGTLLSVTAAVLGGIGVLVRRMIRAERARPGECEGGE